MGQKKSQKSWKKSWGEKKKVGVKKMSSKSLKKIGSKNKKKSSKRLKKKMVEKRGIVYMVLRWTSGNSC